MAFLIFAVILVGCAKKEEYIPPSQKPERSAAGPTGLEAYFVDQNQYPQATTQQSSADELVTCSYDGMKMKKSAMQASMEYKGKTLYFCTKSEMEKFKKDPEQYLSRKVKP
jgi:YHS domain-containing protein